MYGRGKTVPLDDRRNKMTTTVHPTMKVYGTAQALDMFDCDDVIYCKCGWDLEVDYDEDQVQSQIETIVAHATDCPDAKTPCCPGFDSVNFKGAVVESHTFECPTLPPVGER